jgi:GTP-binding protein EngB required for normal cell division
MQDKGSLLLAAKRLEGMPLSPHQGEFLAEIRERLYSDKLFIAVVGEFKRGKSTLINAMLGASLLPTGVLPLTNIVTLIEHGPVPSLEVTFRDRPPLEAPADQLPDFVAEAGNPENRKKVRYVRLRFPSPFLESGVVLVDTPGFESLHETQTEEARAYLPRIDIGLFLLSADSPLSAKEMALLDELARNVSQCLVLLNKTDFLTGPERQAMVDYVKSRIAERHPELAESVFPVSARKGLLALREKGAGSRDVGGIGAVMSIVEALVREKGARIQAKSNAKRLLSIARAVKARLRVEADSLRQPIQVLEDRIARFSRGLEGLEVQRGDAEILVDREIERIILDLDAQMNRLRQDLPPAIGSDLREGAKPLAGEGVAGFSARMTALAEERLKVRFEEHLPSIEARMESAYLAVVEKHRARLTVILEELLRLGSEVFSLDLQSWELPEEFSSERRFFYLEGETRPFFDLEGAAVGFMERLLPAGKARERALGRILERVPERVDANCGRVRFDLLRRLKDSAARFQGQLSRLVTESAVGIREAASTALEARSAAEADWSERQERLEVFVVDLEAVERELAGLLEDKD